MMLDIIDDKKILSNLIFKHLKKNVITNCYLSTKEFEDEIELKTLLFREFSTGNLYILKHREDFSILYYYINDIKTAEMELGELKIAIRNSKMIIEIPYKEEPKNVLELFHKSGFEVVLNRIKLLFNNDSDLSEIYSYNDIDWADCSIEDVDAIIEFLSDNFDKYTGCLPLKNTIVNKVISNCFYIIKEKKSKKIIGLLEFDLGKEATIKHLAVAREYRNKGFGKLLVNRLVNAYKNVNVWTTFESKAEHFYKTNGFNETEYNSVVLIHEGE